MPKLRVLSGSEVPQILRDFGFREFARRGSHVKTRRVPDGGRTQSLTVPNHDETDRGTLHAMYRQASRFIPDAEIRPKFFTE